MRAGLKELDHSQCYGSTRASEDVGKPAIEGMFECRIRVFGDKLVATEVTHLLQPRNWKL